MIASRLFRLLAGVAAVIAIITPDTVHACATCFGDPESAMMQGAKNGAILLGAVVYSVLMAMAGVVIHWGIRAKKLAAASKASTTNRSVINPAR